MTGDSAHSKSTLASVNRSREVGPTQPVYVGFSLADHMSLSSCMANARRAGVADLGALLDAEFDLRGLG